MITSIAGSSEYFAGGIVSYCNEVKHNVLGVSEADLNTFGAVSQPVVEQMARGTMRVLGCDCAVATSGIAGPGGGTPSKPVGTVWIAAAYKERILSECYHFGENPRMENILSLIHISSLDFGNSKSKEIDGLRNAPSRFKTQLTGMFVRELSSKRL